MSDSLRALEAEEKLKPARESGAKRGLGRVFATMLASDVSSRSFFLTALLVSLSLLYCKEAYGVPSAVEAFSYPISWNNASVMIALASGFCSAQNVARDFSTRNLVFQIARIGKGRYLAGRYLSCFASTGLATCVACAAFVAVCVFDSQTIVYPNYVASGYYFGPFVQYIYAGVPALWFASVIAVQGLYAGLLGCLGLTCSSLMVNSYIAMSTPFVIYFFWGKLCAFLSLPGWCNVQLLMKCRMSVEDPLLCLLLYGLIAFGIAALSYALYRSSFGRKLAEL